MDALHETEALLRNIGARVGKTAVEAGVAAGVATWGGSGLGVKDLVHLDTAAKIGTTLVVAVGSAMLAAIWNGGRAYFAIKSNREQGMKVLEDDFHAIVKWHPGASDATTGGGGGGGASYGGGMAAGVSDYEPGDGPALEITPVVGQHEAVEDGA